MTPPRTTVVVALPFEVPRLAGFAEGVEVVVAGPGGRRFDAEAGAGPVFIAGTCGLLVTGGRRGALVVPDLVLSEAHPALLRPDVALRDGLVLAAAAARCGARSGTLLEARSIVDEPADRQRLAEVHAAVAVDLESHRLARAAEDAGRPWAVLRWISDTPERPLARLLSILGSPLVEQPPTKAVLTGLLRRPALVLPLAALALSATLGRSRAGRVLRLALGSRAAPHGFVP